MSPESLKKAPSPRDLVRYIRGELRYFRERGRPVLFAVTPDESGRMPQVVPELTPRTGEVVLKKPAPSAFFGTDLDERLPDSVRRLTIVGLETPTSILLTAGDAMSRGFQVVVPEPCAAAENPEDHEFAMRLIRDLWRPWGPSRGPEIPMSMEGRAISDEGEPS